MYTFRTSVIDTDILASIHKITTDPLISNTSYTIVIKFFYENIMVNSIKGLFRSMNIPTEDLQSSIEVVIFSTS